MAASGASETWEQYEARLIEFLRVRPGGHPMAKLGVECGYAPARGEKGFFSKLVRSKPRVFEFADPDCASGPRLLRLAASAPPRREPPPQAAAPAAAPPTAAWLAAEEEEYAARLVAYLRDSGAWHDTYALSKACQMPSHLLSELSSQGKGFFRRFLDARPQLFQLNGPMVRLARSQPPKQQAAVSNAPVSGAAAAPSSEAAYEARLVAYLRQAPGGELGLSNLAAKCPWVEATHSLRVANGKGSGVYSAFVRARPHLFELVPREHGQHIVRLARGLEQKPVPPPQAQQAESSPPQVLWQAQPRPVPRPVPQAVTPPPSQPPPQSDSAPHKTSEAEYEARLVAFIRSLPGQSTMVSRIGEQCPWDGARGVPGAYLRFVRNRPHAFQVVEKKGGQEVRLQQQQQQQPPRPAPRAAASPQAAAPSSQQSRTMPQPRVAPPPYTPPAEPVYAARSLLPPPPPSLLPPAPPASVAAPSLLPALAAAVALAPTEAAAPSLLPPLPVPLPLPLMPQWGPPPPPPLPTSLPPASKADSGAAAALAAPLRVALSGPSELCSSPGGTTTIVLTLVNNGDATVVVCSAAIRAPRPDLRLMPATPLPRVLVPQGKLVLALQHLGETPCVATVVVDAVVESTNEQWWVPNAPQPQTAVATAAVTLRCAAA